MHRETSNAVKNKEGALSDQIYMRCASAVAVGFTSYEKRIACGSLVNVSTGKEFTFYGLDQMLLVMDDIMDVIKYPYPTFSHRYFYDKPYVFEKELEEAPEPSVESAVESWLSNTKVDMIIRVYHRQQCSMQGQVIVTGKSGQMTMRFRSALELARLIHEFLETELNTDER